MKKALSVLLVAAALFGFYGSAVTVNDLLACKDYWEEAGEQSTANMNKLEDGLNQLKDNEQAYLDGQGQVAEGEETLAAGEATLAQGEADYAAAPGKLAAARTAIANGEKELAKGKSTLAGAKDLLKQLKDGVKELQDEEEGYPAWKNGMAATRNDLSGSAKDQATAAQYKYMYKIGQACTEDGVLKDSLLEATSKKAAAALGDGQSAGSLNDAIVAYVTGRTGVLFQKRLTSDPPNIADGDPNPEGTTPQTIYPKTLAAAQQDAQAEIMGKLKADSLKGIQAIMTADKATVGDDYQKINQKGSIAFNDAMTMGVADGLRKLPAGKKKIQDKLLPLLDKKAVKDNAVIKKQLGDVNKLIKGLKGDDKTFEATMDQIMKKAPALVAAVQKAVNKGQNDLNAGKRKLASGKSQYRQGLADYAAAPGKLADGRAQLEEGRKALADGKAQLAQYEDGEQQIRDGLATLFNTEADLELESIANRLNGDGDFDNGDNHLEIDEGLNAVEVGRGYQAEDGVLITNEIMGRAVATGGLIGAAVLAVLAAILSFLKKNKGAAVFALLAAAAGAFGAFYGPAQGTYFSDIAGSTVGTLTWVAAGVLGAVALVHAIAHFAAPKNA